MGAEIHGGRTDGRTGRGMTKLIVAFHNFLNAPKNTHVYVLFLSFSPLFPHPYYCCLLTIRGALPFHPLIWTLVNRTCIKLFCFVNPPPDSISVRHWQYLLSVLWISSILWGEFRKFLCDVLRLSLPSFVPILCISPYGRIHTLPTPSADTALLNNSRTWFITCDAVTMKLLSFSSKCLLN